MVVAIREFPAGNAGKESVYNDELLDCIGVDNHEADVVPDKTSHLHADPVFGPYGKGGLVEKVSAECAQIGLTIPQALDAAHAGMRTATPVTDPR